MFVSFRLLIKQPFVRLPEPRYFTFSKNLNQTTIGRLDRDILPYNILQ